MMEDYQNDAPPYGEPVTQRTKFVPAYATALNPIDAGDLLTKKFAARQTILTPWLPEKGLAMIHAPRGIGKTHLALNIAYAVASGSSFLGWEAGRARRVVYIDGEMPASLLQSRFKDIDRLAALQIDNPDNFKLVASDVEPDGLPDLSDPEKQRFFDGVIADADLIVLDNLSTLARGGRENEADSWGPIQDWLLTQRRNGKSVLLIHHSGKSGGQRGSSRKEDVLDTVIALKRPPDYVASQGARFEVIFEKNRGFFGQAAESFEAQLLTDGSWLTGPIVTDDDDDSIRALAKSGLSYSEISKRTGKSKSVVGRICKGGGDD